MPAEVYVHTYEYPPEVMGAKEAAAFLDVGETQFRSLCDTYPDRLRPFNLLPDGQKKWRTQTLREYAKWRESVGVEPRAERAG